MSILSTGKMDISKHKKRVVFLLVRYKKVNHVLTHLQKCTLNKFQAQGELLETYAVIAVNFYPFQWQIFFSGFFLLTLFHIFLFLIRTWIFFSRFFFFPMNDTTLDIRILCFLTLHLSKKLSFLQTKLSFYLKKIESLIIPLLFIIVYYLKCSQSKRLREKGRFFYQTTRP